MLAIFGSAKKAIAKVADSAKKLVKSAANKVSKAVKSVGKAVTSTAKGIASGASKTLRNISSGVKVLVPWVKGKIVAFAQKVTGTVGFLYRNLWGKYAEGFCDLWDGFWGKLRGIIDVDPDSINPLKQIGKGLADWAFSLYYKYLPDNIRDIASKTFMFGFEYDEEQKITYTVPEAPQQYAGYTPTYDLASRDVGFDIAAQIITFQYGGKEYMIETWKGDYWGAAGCEVGIYSRDKDEIRYDPYFYDCATDDQMQMSMTLKKAGTDDVLFTRSDRHWWLTGFKPCEYYKPEELEMEISITFDEKGMAEAFSKALPGCHTASNIKTNGSIVSWQWEGGNKTDKIEKTISDYIGKKVNDEVYDELMEGTLDELTNKLLN